MLLVIYEKRNDDCENDNEVFVLIRNDSKIGGKVLAMVRSS